MGCKFGGASLNCHLPIKISFIEDIGNLFDGLTKPITDVATNFKASIKAVYDMKLDGTSDLRPDNATGLFSRIVHADAANATINCQSPHGRHLPVTLSASRVLAGCAYDYTSLLRFPCERIGTNISSIGSNFNTNCELPYSDSQRGWASLPGSCNRTDIIMDEARSSLQGVLNDQNSTDTDISGIILGGADAFRYGRAVPPSAVPTSRQQGPALPLPGADVLSIVSAQNGVQQLQLQPPKQLYLAIAGCC